jgi:hypothetical protein
MKFTVDGQNTFPFKKKFNGDLMKRIKKESED